MELLPLKLSDPAARRARPSLIRPKLVLAESMTNPLARGARTSRPSPRPPTRPARRCAVDGTFTSPALQRTLSQGADYALHSTTKWINGHSRRDRRRRLRHRARASIRSAARGCCEGALLGPFEAWLTLRGLRTLPVRMAAHSTHAPTWPGGCAEYAARRAGALPRAPRPSGPRGTARALLHGGFGGMVAFEIAGAGRAGSFRFLEALQALSPGAVARGRHDAGDARRERQRPPADSPRSGPRRASARTSSASRWASRTRTTSPRTSSRRLQAVGQP